MSRREKEAMAMRQQKLQQLSQQATQFINTSKSTHLNRNIKHLEWASNTYVGYGYNVAFGVGMMGACIGLSSRFAFLGNMASMLALGTGFFVGGFVHKAHIMAAQGMVVKGITAALPDAERMNDQYGPEGCADYGNYVQWLNALNMQMQPRLAMEEAAKEATLTIDDRVDDIIAQYEARKASAGKK